jgi:hypothetical protein
MQTQSTQGHRDHRGRNKGEEQMRLELGRSAGFSLCSLWLCVLCVVLVFSGLVSDAATVQTVDDATIKDASLTFDGQVLTVTSTTQPTPTTMPLEDVARIVLSEPAAEITPTPGATPGATPSITRVRRVRKKKAAASPTTGPAAPATTVAPGVVAPGIWRMKLMNGDVMHGTVAAWADQHVVVRPDVIPDAEVGISASALDWVWHGDPADQAKAEAMNIARGDQDTAFVRKDGDIVAVRGTAAGIDGDELLFSYEGQDRKINLEKIIGIVFGQPGGQHGAKADESFHQVFRFLDGERISGRWIELANKVCTVKTDAEKPARFGLSSLAGIDLVNGRITYLSDLTPSKVEQTPFFDEIIPYKTDAALDGGPLKLGDAVYDKGIAVHARCILEYDMGGRFDRFRTKMGFEPGAGALGDARVSVLGDGRVLYEDKEAKGTDQPVAIDVDASGVTHLTLEVDFGEGQDVGDRVVWADARAVKAK